MSEPADLWEITLRLFLAAVAGGVLGWERERQQKPAGLRTHMMVALGSAIFMAVSLRLMHTVAKGSGELQFDPLRVLQGIIGGIGFLGAGAIIQSRGDVKGLTTAASIWLVAAIGVTCAVGEYAIAGLSAGLGFTILKGVGMFEVRVLGKLGEDASQASEEQRSSGDETN